MEQSVVAGGKAAAGSSLSENLARPFLRWVGSKQRLLAQIMPWVPEEFETYYEPFLGSGSMFFALQPKKARLSDRSDELISTYVAVRDNVAAIMRYLNPLRPDPNLYYSIRKNRSNGRFKRAAEFIYLNKTCWNGLYRVNLKGEFNVPYGRPRSEVIYYPEQLRTCSDLLRRSSIHIKVADFEKVVVRAKRNDFVYFDPPYVTKHNNNGFAEWNEDIFSWADQVRLAKLASELANAGVRVLVSNADHQDIKKLYPRFGCVRLQRNSTLASDAAKRTVTTEILLVGPQ